MITIINSAPAASVVKRMVCQECGVTLEYTPKDVKSCTHADYTGSKDTYYYIECPACSSKVYE